MTSFSGFPKERVSVIFGFRKVTDISGRVKPDDDRETGVGEDERGTRKVTSVSEGTVRRLWEDSEP